MQKRILKIRGRRFDLSKRPLVMGVLNITPDSFTDGGRYLDVQSACRRALEIEREGADILDIGGESTRPGSLSVSLEDELNRVIPVIRRLKGRLRIPVSVDTTKHEVAGQCLKEGACIINDVSGLRAGSGLAELCARYSAGIIIMHMKGRPRTMQKRPVYDNLFGEIRDYLKKGIAIALSAGVKKEGIVIDPGIGFGKTLRHNLSVIKNADYFKRLGYPLLIGVSKKSFLGRITGLGTGQRSIPTAAANALAVYCGADIIRVHDVRESIAALKVAYSVKKS
jgi:dihydropteroate synthase